MKEQTSKACLKQVGVNLPLVTAKNKEVKSFALFGGQGDSNKFYPDLNVTSSLIPKEEDFIKVPFRLLSATIVGGDSWKATDFSNEEVLRASMNKLTGKVVYYDHDTDLNNWVGVIDSVSWSERRMQDGLEIPAGIDGVILIDGKTSPKIARGVLIGAIYSNSVTLSFDWVQSHSFSDDDGFLDNIGKRGEDGKLIRRIVTKIHDYFESSLVWLGADPFAKSIQGDGKLKNIDETYVYNEYNKNSDEAILYTKEKRYSLPFCLNKNILSLSQKKSNNKNKFNSTMKEFIKQFETIFGFNESKLRDMLGLKEGVDITKEAFDDYFNLQVKKAEETDVSKILFAESVLNLPSSKEIFGEEINYNKLSTDNLKLVKQDEFDNLSEKVDQIEKVTKEKNELGLKVASLEVNAEIGKNFIQNKRNEVKRLYKLNVTTPDEAVLKLMDEVDLKALEGLLKQYTKETTGKFSGKCKGCGSENFEFKSTLSEEQTLENDDDAVVSYKNLYQKFDNHSMDLRKK